MDGRNTGVQAPMDREQLREEFARWQAKSAETKKKNAKTLLIFILLIPVTALVGYFFIAVNAKAWKIQDKVMAICSAPVVALIVGSVAYGVKARSKRKKEIAPLAASVAGHLVELHTLLQREVFGSGRIQVGSGTIGDPDAFEPGIRDHILGLDAHKARDWYFTLSCCSGFSYRESPVRLCSVYMEDSDTSSDHTPVRVSGIYMAVHPGSPIDIPFDPLHVRRRTREDGSRTNEFERWYTGERKAGKFGSREKVDSLPLFPRELRRAMLAFTWEASRRVVREAWITAAGDFYFLLGEDRQNKIYGDGYDETEQVYRELYTRLRDLADACIEMSHGDGSRPLKKSE